MNDPNIKTSKLVLIAFFALSFYCLGNTMMVHYYNYPTFDKIQENIKPAMQLFNSRLIILNYIPKFLLFLTSIALLKYSSTNLSRRAIWFSILLIGVSVLALFYFIIPIHSSLPETGFTTAIQKQLIDLSLLTQVLTIAVQSLLAVYLLNLYLKEQQLFGRWLFIITSALIFYLAGGDYADKFINYFIWEIVGQKDWVAYRNVETPFVLFYVLPAFLPIIFLILMIWKRPKSIPRFSVFVCLFIELFVLFVTGSYFVPKIQAPLTQIYSVDLIQELMKNDFPLRGIPLIILIITTIYMFLRVEENMIFVKEKE